MTELIFGEISTWDPRSCRGQEAGWCSGVSVCLQIAVCHIYIVLCPSWYVTELSHSHCFPLTRYFHFILRGCLISFHISAFFGKFLIYNCNCSIHQIEARSVENIKAKAKGLENKIIELSQKLDEKVGDGRATAGGWQYMGVTIGSRVHIYLSLFPSSSTIA